MLEPRKVMSLDLQRIIEGCVKFSKPIRTTQRYNKLEVAMRLIFVWILNHS